MDNKINRCNDNEHTWMKIEDEDRSWCPDCFGNPVPDAKDIQMATIGGGGGPMACGCYYATERCEKCGTYR